MAETRVLEPFSDSVQEFDETFFSSIPTDLRYKKVYLALNSVKVKKKYLLKYPYHTGYLHELLPHKSCAKRDNH